MVIGMLGLSRSQFANYCKINEFKRVTDTEYEIKGDTYVYIDTPTTVYGRRFDRVYDFDPLRAEVYKRMPVKNEYHIEG